MESKESCGPRWLKLLPAVIKRQINGRPHLQRVIGNTGWLVADSLFRMLIGLVVGIWVARYLGPTSFGELNYALALVGMFSVIAGLGIDGNIVRDLVREPDKQGEILGTAFRLKLVGSAVMIVACIALVAFLRTQETQMIWLTAILSAGMAFLAVETISLWFQAQTQSKYTVYAKGLAYALGAMIRVELLLNEAPLIAFAWAALVESSVVALGLLLVYYKNQSCSPTAWVANWARAKAMLHDGWPLLFSAVSAILYMRLDAVMLGQLSNDHAVGIYGAATRISEIWYFIPMAITASLQPTLVRMREQNPKKFQEQLTWVYSLFSLVSFCVSVSVTFMANKLVVLLYGQSYLEAGPVLSLHIWASIAVFLGVASDRYLIIEQLQRITLYRTLIGLICNVVLNFLLIPPYGALGAAWATLISYSLATASLTLFQSTALQGRVMLRTLMPDQWLKLLKWQTKSS